MKNLYNGKVINETGTLIRGRGSRAATSKAPRSLQTQY